MRIYRSAEFRRMPWKNGGGETIEIAASPPGASLDDFHWRISMAHVASPGPFSIFPGVDRTIAVIDGAGISLHVAGRGTMRLGPDAAPFSFPGDLHVEAALTDGPTEDLNVMTRRVRYRHWLSRIRSGAPVVLPRLGDLMIVLSRHSAATLRAGGNADKLDAGDAAVLDESDGARFEIAPHADAELLVVDLWRN